MRCVPRDSPFLFTFRFFDKKVYKAGIRNSDRKVEKINPPTTAIPKDCLLSDEAPIFNAMGRIPSTMADEVMRIDPATGVVRGTIDFSGLLAPQDRGPETDVLNGIAYDAESDRLFITGKRWPKIFEVRLKALP